MLNYYLFRKTAFFLVIALATASAVTWVHTSGPEGGHIKCLFAGNGTVLAGVTDGLYLSTDNCASWLPFRNGLPGGTAINTIVTSDSTFLAGTNNGIAFYDIHRQQWVGINAGFPAFTAVTAIAGCGSTLVAGTSAGVYLLSETGTEWTKTPDDQLRYSPVSAIMSFGGALFAASLMDVFRSDDCGMSWTKMSKGLPQSHINSLVVNGTMLFACSNRGIYSSIDSGQNWSQAFKGLTDSTALSIVVNGNDLIEESSHGAFRSTDNGITWSSITAGLFKGILSDVEITAIAADGKNIYLGTAKHGVFLSTNNGAQWIQANCGLVNSMVEVLASNGKYLFAGCSNASSGLYRTGDDGATWSSLDSGTLSKQDVVSLAADHDSVYVADGYGFLTKVSVDGTDLHLINLVAGGGTPHWSFAGTVSGSPYLFMSLGDAGTFLSRNGGATWSMIELGPTTRDNDVLSLWGSGNRLLAGSHKNGLYMSVDAGDHFARIENLGSRNIWAIASVGSRIFAGTDYGIFTSSNGTAWDSVNGGLPSSTWIKTLAVAGGDIYAGTYNAGVFVSKDSGISWVAINDGLPESAEISSLVVHGENLFAAIGATGVWRLPLANAVVNNRYSRPAPGSILRVGPAVIGQSSVSLHLKLQKSGPFTLSVVDVKGQRVATLADGNYPAGEQILSWDSRHARPGHYFFVLQSDCDRHILQFNLFH